MSDDPTEDREIKQLSGMRRAIYWVAISRGDDHETALRIASARCCSATLGHTATCENNPGASGE